MFRLIKEIKGPRNNEVLIRVLRLCIWLAVRRCRDDHQATEIHGHQDRIAFLDFELARVEDMREVLTHFLGSHDRLNVTALADHFTETRRANGDAAASAKESSPRLSFHGRRFADAAIATHVVPWAVAHWF